MVFVTASDNARRASRGAVVRSYAWGLDLSGSEQGAGGVGGLLWMSHAGTGRSYFYEYDGNGNVMSLVDTRTNWMPEWPYWNEYDPFKDFSAQYDYSPFGELLRATGAMANENPFRFSTKYQDEETGLLYYGYRYYRPETGRWFSRDPIEEAGGRNLYLFTNNDPVGLVDPMGRNVVTHILNILWQGFFGWGGHHRWADDGTIQNRLEVQSAVTRLKDDIRNRICKCETIKDELFDEVRFGDTLFREYLYGTSSLYVKPHCTRTRRGAVCPLDWRMYDRFDLHPNQYWTDGVLAALLNYQDYGDLPSWVRYVLRRAGPFYSFHSFSVDITWSSYMSVDCK